MKTSEIAIKNYSGNSSTVLNETDEEFAGRLRILGLTESKVTIELVVNSFEAYRFKGGSAVLSLDRLPAFAE